MSRILGRSYDVYLASKELKDAHIRKYKDDHTKTSWKSIDESPEKYQMYLPDSAIEYLTDKKIKICKDPFLLYTEMQIPCNEEEDRYIKFPSMIPIEKFKTELAYFIGMLLADYHVDNEETLYSFPKEYSDLLPLLIVYLRLKVDGKEEEFRKKYLSILSNYVGTYITDYEAYKDFEDFYGSAIISEMTREQYDKLVELSKENEEKMTSAVGETIIQLSAMDGALQIIDRCKSEEDFKNVIEALFLNKDGDRSSLLREQGIESYGYKRLRKEIEAIKNNCKK